MRPQISITTDGRRGEKADGCYIPSKSCAFFFHLGPMWFLLQSDNGTRGQGEKMTSDWTNMRRLGGWVGGVGEHSVGMRGRRQYG